jgi:hypothetical protein
MKEGKKELMGKDKKRARCGDSHLESQLHWRWRSGGSRFKANLGKSLSRPHLNQQAECGGTHLSFQTLTGRIAI